MYNELKYQQFQWPGANLIKHLASASQRGKSEIISGSPTCFIVGKGTVATPPAT